MTERSISRESMKACSSESACCKDSESISMFNSVEAGLGKTVNGFSKGETTNSRFSTHEESHDPSHLMRKVNLPPTPIGWEPTEKPKTGL